MKNEFIENGDSIRRSDKNMDVIEVKNLKKYYSTKNPLRIIWSFLKKHFGPVLNIFIKDLEITPLETKAVDDVSFTVKRGERFGFLGPNGAGKTTTIRSILGLLRGVKGEIFIAGEKINPNKDRKFRNKIGYIPGEFGLEQALTGLENVKYVAKLYDLKIDFDYVNEIASRMKLDLHRPVQELSKGNKQKVGCVIGLMGDFPIYIFDEPTSGLDPIMNNEFFKILTERQEQTQAAVFISSHMLAEIEKYCDRVAIIKKGKIVELSDISILKEKGLKNFELEFTSTAGLEEFMQFLKTEFSEIEIIDSHVTSIDILIPPEKKRIMLHEISERKWGGEYIRDFNISNSSLEEIFMKFYEVEENKMEVN
ncbi:MAG: ABC transporter ATP-binding protein [archaeon]|nr:ABC transporter ATP-binding protein [archaeon]